MKKKRNFLTLFLILGLTILSIAVTYLYSINQIKNDKSLLVDKLNNLFDGKNSIGDGFKMAFEGEFTDKSRMHYTFTDGGFSIYELTKENDGFVKSITTSGDLEYKESEYGYNSGGYFFSGYYTSNHRPSVQKCYDGAYEFLLKGNEDDRKQSYTPNKLTEIKNFPNGFRTEYHFTSQHEHPTEFYSSQNGGGKVYTDEYELEYNIEKTYYKVKENEEAINKSLLINSSIGGFSGIIIALIISLILKLFSPHKGNDFGILNVKWRNSSNNAILTISPKTLGKYPAVLVENNIPQNGSAKIKDDNIEITFPNSVYYYQISRKEGDILELKNLTTNELILFEKLGSNAIQNQIHISNNDM